MSTKERVIAEMEDLSEPLLEQVLDFVRFLKGSTPRANLDISIMSECSLSKDWLKPEEDEAWRDL